MRSRRLAIVLAFLPVVAAAPLFAADSPCGRSLGAKHESALTGTRPSELDVQKDCLTQETTLSPKAELLPPSDGGPVTRAAAKPAPLPGKTFTPAFLLEPGSQSFRLGNAQEMFGSVVPPPPGSPR